MTAEGWTVAEARAEFARTGIPIDGLAPIIRNLPGFRRIGEKRKPPGSQGGRGPAVYDIGDLQLLHGFLAQHGWLTPQGADQADAAAARRARASIKAGEPVIPWEEIKAEAGLTPQDP